jgi:PhnB protein
MASRLNPYISFDGDARDALQFYAGVFGGEPQLMPFSAFEQEASPMSDKIMHGQLDTPSGYTIMAADTPPQVDRTPGNNITVSLSGDEESELRGYFDGLAEGGTVSMPLDKQMWGDTFGMLTDRFGINWMINIAGESAGT